MERSRWWFYPSTRGTVLFRDAAENRRSLTVRVLPLGLVQALEGVVNSCPNPSSLEGTIRDAEGNTLANLTIRVGFVLPGQFSSDLLADARRLAVAMHFTPKNTISPTDEAARPSPSSSVANAGASECSALADPQPASSASVALSTDDAPASSSPSPDAPSTPSGVRIPTTITFISPKRRLNIHPAAAAYPINKKKFEELRADIHEKRILKAIYVIGNTIIDGVQRWTIAQELDIDCPAIEMSLDDLNGVHVVDFIRSVNEQTRHLTKSQYAMVAARSRGPYVAAAKLRRAKAGAKRSRESSRELPTVTGDVRTILSKIFNIGENIYDCAVAVLDSKCDDLINAVVEGKLSAFPAAEILDLPEPVRTAAIELAAKGDRKSLRTYLQKDDSPKASDGESTSPVTHAGADTAGDVSPTTTDDPLAPSTEYPEATVLDNPGARPSVEQFNLNSDGEASPKSTCQENGCAADKLMSSTSHNDHVVPPPPKPDDSETAPSPVGGLQQVSKRHVSPLGTTSAAHLELLKLIGDGLRAATVLIDPDWKSVDEQELADLPVSEVLADDAVVVIWAPPEVTPAIELLHGWGLRITESVVAIGKPTNGHGYFRQAHRIALIAKRGNPSRPEVRPFHSWCGDQLENYDRAHQDMNACMGEALPEPRLQIFGSVVSRHDTQWTSVACEIRRHVDA